MKMVLKKSAAAGTLESSDAMICISPNEGQGIRIELNSAVEAQFGGAIRACIEKVLSEFEVSDADVTVTDKGALDCVIRARTRCAVCRAMDMHYDWTREDGNR